MLFSESTLKKQFEDLGIQNDDTVFIHSSMRAIGNVNNGAHGVLDALISYLKNGLLIFPTHSWNLLDNDDYIFNPLSTPSCVGILSNLFMQRPNVVRSWHPTHSVAALGKSSINYIKGEEQLNTPCSRNGCYGKLYDMNAKILFIGCGLKTNTLIHGVEEWNNIPNRLSENRRLLRIQTPDGILLERPFHTHHDPIGDISKNYDIIEDALITTNIAIKNKIGNATTYLCHVKPMVDMVSSFLSRNNDLFLNQTPIPKEWYQQ